MGKAKRNYMEVYDPLAAIYFNIIKEKIKQQHDEELYYATLCDNSNKD
jgi:hypothetical protein